MKILTFLFMSAAMILLGTACSTPHTTNTAKSAVEEGLTCAAVERALDKADISKYKGKTVFMDYSYLSPQTQKDLCMAYMEKRCAENEMTVSKDAAKADVIFQLYCGVLATDIDKFLFGTPPLPVPVPDTSVSIVIPEISLFSKYSRSAYARFYLTIKDAKTNKPLETITELNAHTQYVNWVILLIPFKTHSTDLEHTPSESELIPVWEE